MILDDIFQNENEQPLDKLISDGGYTSVFRTICCVGDSLSSGELEADNGNGASSYHDMFEYSWGQFIARMCGSKVYNFSRGGMTAKEYCESFAEHNGFWNPKYASDAYIIALGVNDLFGLKQKVGQLSDIDFSDWHNNKQSFAGYYAEVIQRLKAIQPRAKFFLMTMPRENENENDSGNEIKKEHRRLLYKLAEKLNNTYVIDFFKYAPIYNEEFKKKFYLRGHMNPMGYLLTAKLTASYIDYIIRHNMEDFKEIGFIGTNLHG